MSRILVKIYEDMYKFKNRFWFQEKKKVALNVQSDNNNIFILYNFVSLLVAKHYYNTGWESADGCCNPRISVLSSKCDLASMVSLQPLCSMAKKGHPFSNLLWNVWFYGSSMHR